MYFLAIYALINLAAILATFLRLVILMSCGLQASKKLFARLLAVVMKAPMSFFDTTPIGRYVHAQPGSVECMIFHSFSQLLVSC
jgi:ABC-type multidrug transport system fused ATPase/permease subunit